MKVLITGGAGFLGARLARALLSRGALDVAGQGPQPIDELVLLDVAAARGFEDDVRVRTMTGDIAEAAVLEQAIGAETAAIFHLAAIVSGQAETDFDLGMRINLDASRRLLERCRALGHRPRVVFTSSVAVFGGVLPELVRDDTALNPQSSYGTEKAIAELLLSDYTRRGFVDGRVLRLPTISVRPGRPNAATSSFASGIVREPLNGETAVIPVPRDVRVWLLSPRRAIDCLIAGCELDGGALGTQRALNLPGVSASVDEMVAAVRDVAGDAVANRIEFREDAWLTRIVSSWPAQWDTSRARSLGLEGDVSFADIVRCYIEDEGIRIAGAASQ